MKNIFIDFLLALLLSSVASAQMLVNPKLTEEESLQCFQSLTHVKLRGLQLGMTAANVKKLYPEIQIPFSDLGGLSKTETHFIVWKNSAVRKISENIIDKGKYGELDGLEAISLSFVNYKLTSIFFFYEPNIEWAGTMEFASLIRENLKLPKKWSLTRKAELSLASMQCMGIGIVAGIGTDENDEQHPLLAIINNEAEEIAGELADEKLEELENAYQNAYKESNNKKKKVFRP